MPIVLLLLLLLTMGATSLRAAPVTWPDYIVKVWAQTCSTPPNSRFLTGFAADGFDGYLTSLHGVAGCSHIQVMTGELSYQQVTLTKIDLDNDVALLNAPSSLTINRLPVGATVTPGETVEIIGFPNAAFSPFFHTLHITPELAYKTWEQSDSDILSLLRKRIIAAGRVSPSLTATMITLQGPVVPGHSGAPIVNTKGEVIGIAQGALKFGTTAFAVPIRSVHLTERERVDSEYRALGAISPEPLYSLTGYDEEETARRRLARLGIDPTRVALLRYAELGGLEEVNLLLKLLDSDNHDPGGPTALEVAAKAGHLDLVKSLIAAGADRGYSTDSSGVPEEAVASGRLDIVEAVLGYDNLPASPPKVRELSQRALAAAIKADSSDIVAMILNVEPTIVNDVLPTETSVLHLAARVGASRTLPVLLAADPEIRLSPEGLSPFALAVKYHQPKAARLLLGTTKPAELGGCTPLGYAAAQDSAEVVTELASDDQINSPACGSETALFVSAKAGALRAEAVLLALNAFVRNPYTGAESVPYTSAHYNADEANNRKLKLAILAGKQHDALLFQLRGIQEVDTRLDGGLLSAAAYMVNETLVQELLRRASFKVYNGQCTTYPEDDASNFPIQALLAGAAGMGSERVAAAKSIIDMVLGEDEEIIKLQCGDWSPARLAVRSLSLLTYLDQKHANLGFDWEATAMLEAILGGYDASAKYLSRYISSVCEEGASAVGSKYGFYSIGGYGLRADALAASVFKDNAEQVRTVVALVDKYAPRGGHNNCTRSNDSALLKYSACEHKVNSLPLFVARADALPPALSDFYEEAIICLINNGQFDSANVLVNQKGGMFFADAFTNIKTDEGRKFACSIYRQRAARMKGEEGRRLGELCRLF